MQGVSSAHLREDESLCSEIRGLWEYEYPLVDFGSGYSSLNYVKDIPVDDFNIDKSFIDGLGKTR